MNPFAPLVKYAIAALAAIGAVLAVVFSFKRQKTVGIEQGQAQVITAVRLAEAEKEIEIVVAAQEVEREVEQIIESPATAKPDNVVERVRNVYGNRRSPGK